MWRWIPALVFGTLLLVGAIASRGDRELTFERVEAIAEQQLADAGCTFSVRDESREGVEDKALLCKVDGDAPHTVVEYSHYDDADSPVVKYGLQFTTADRYFQHQTTTVRPSGAQAPGQPVLDAQEFSEAIKEDCGCGEVLTPEE